MAETETEVINPFDAIREQIVFKGFTESQKEAMLDQLDAAYNAEGGTTARDMIDDGLALPNGLTIHNSNDQETMVEYASDTADELVSDFKADNPGVPVTQAEIDQLKLNIYDGGLAGDFAPEGTTGNLYISSEPALDSTGAVETYTHPGSATLGQTADASAPFKSIDHDGAMFNVPPIYTLLHEMNHTVRGDIDLADDQATLEANIANGQYYSTDSTGNAADDYRGPNETATQKMLEEMGYTQFRGAYVGNWDATHPVGTDLGLGRSHEVGVTAGDIDMTTHDAVDAVVVGVQGGANTFKLGDGNDTVHAFDDNDTVFTGAGDDRVFLGSGNDIAHAGWGSKTIDGGDANLDPASDHRSNTTTDWGIDTVDYTKLDAGFAAADGISVDGTARDGMLMTIDGDSVTVNKGQRFSPMPGEDIDQLHNIDVVRGSARDDLTVVDNMSDGQLIDGGDGVDTLRFPEDTTNVATPGTLASGATYEGYLEGADGSKLYYTDYETVEPATVEASSSAEVEGATQAIPMEEALKLLRDEGTSLEADAGPTGDALRTPGARAIMQTLVENDQTELHVSTEAMNGTPGDQVAEVLRAASNTIEERGLTEEAEDTYEHMVEEQGVSQEQQAEQSRVNDEQASYDMAM